MSERKEAVFGGFVCMLLGAGLFLWDFLGDAFHFFWFIPFFMLTIPHFFMYFNG